MLGSAIPRRWVFSLALVGLVTIFAVSYSAVWSSTANADSQGTAGGTGNSVVLAPEETLVTANTLPSGLTLQPGQQLQVTLTPVDATEAENDSLPTTTFSWTSTGGIAIVAGASAPTVVIQANSSGTLHGEILQIQFDQQWVVKRDMTITVAAAAPTSTPLPEPVNPGPVPSSIPNSQGVVQPIASILVSSTGVETGSSPQASSLNNRPVIFIRRGSVDNFVGVQVNTVDPTTLSALPAGFTRGSAATDITFVDVAGVALPNFRLLRSAQVCLPTSSTDRVNGGSNVKLLRLGSTSNQWIPLTSTYNVITQQVCANSSNFSILAVGVQQIPATAAPPGTGLPATGGWSPTTSLLVLVGLLGVAFAGGGAITMLRARNASRPE